MPTISHASLNSPHTTIKEVPIITELLQRLLQLVTKTQLKMVEAATKPQPEVIECQLMVRQHMIPIQERVIWRVMER